MPNNIALNINCTELNLLCQTDLHIWYSFCADCQLLSKTLLIWFSQTVLQDGYVQFSEWVSSFRYHCFQWGIRETTLQKRIWCCHQANNIALAEVCGLWLLSSFFVHNIARVQLFSNATSFKLPACLYCMYSTAPSKTFACSHRTQSNPNWPST